MKLGFQSSASGECVHLWTCRLDGGGREGSRASPHRALAPPPTQLKYVRTHTDTHTGSPGFCCLSCGCVAACYMQASFCCPGTWPILLGPPWAAPPSETPGHIPAQPMSFQHPGPSADAVSLKKPLLNQLHALRFTKNLSRDKNLVQATYLECGPRSTIRQWRSESEKSHLGAVASETGRVTPENSPPVVIECLP